MADPTRRDLLKGVLPLITLPGVIRPADAQGKAELTSPADIPTRGNDPYAVAELYRGYAIFWTGWKAGPYDDSFMGQWLAWPHPREQHQAYGEKAYIYAVVPHGVVDFYRKGEMFNCAPQRDLCPPNTPLVVSFESGIEERAQRIAEGRLRLQAFIDREGYRG